MTMGPTKRRDGGAMAVTKRDEELMAVAVEQARRGVGRTHPNPCVGCVIADADGEVVATGYHARAGEAHAEVDAISSVPAGVDLTAATIYVTLEPCCVWGRTPPCTDAIREAGIPRVVIGSVDPDPRVHGKGVGSLRESGVEVLTGVLADTCDELIAPFAKRILTGLPWVSAKWAMSLDGKIATRTMHSAWITGEAARERGHELRDVHDAILVGTGTLRHDNPRLTCRIDGGRDPWRVLIDAELSAPLESTALDPASASAPTVVLTTERAEAERRAVLKDRGVQVLEVPTVGASGWMDLEAALRVLAEQGLTSVLVEGGGTVLGSLFDAQLIDRVYAFIAPKLIGGAEAVTPIAGLGLKSMEGVPTLRDARSESLDGDLLIWGDVPEEQRAHIACWSQRIDD